MIPINWVSLAFKTTAAILLFYIAYRDIKTHKIKRWHGILFFFLAFISVGIKSVQIALFLTVAGAVIGAILWKAGGIARFDVVILTGACLLMENIWFPYLVAMVTYALAVYEVYIKHKPYKYPYTLIIAVAWLLLTVAGVIARG